LPVEFVGLGVDLMSVSAHKFGGPKGVGALVVRDGLEIEPLIAGGGQERRRRAGTESVVAIAGFGAAASAASAELTRMPVLATLRREIEAAILAFIPGSLIVGSEAPRLANTICFTWPGKSAEALVIKMDLGGVAISAGSACSSGKVGPSHVLAAMGLPDAAARSAVRVSMGLATGEHEIDRFFATIMAIAGHVTGEPVTIENMPRRVSARLQTIMGEA
jgi:cysteine desulfurase